MERYKQRTISELLKKTYKLNRPRMTPILEGKDRMQGPLDNADDPVVFAAIQVCRICRNHLDASIAQNCCVCTKSYHSFCLEAPCQASRDPSLSCCYYCQQKAALDTNQPGPSPKGSLDKLSDDGTEIWRSTENKHDCDEPGTSYDASEQSPARKRMDWVWNEISPSKCSVDSIGTIFDTVFTPTKTRAARKLGIRRKRIPDNSGQESSCSQVLPSEAGAPRTVLQSSGVDTVQAPIMAPLEQEGGCIAPVFPSIDIEDVKGLNCTTVPIQSKNVREQVALEIGNGEEMLKGCTVSPNKNGKFAMEEVATGDESIVTGAEKMMGTQKPDLVLMSRPMSGSAGMVSEHVCLAKASGGSPRKIQEETSVIFAPGSVNSGLVWHSSDGTLNDAAQVASEGDLVGMSETFLQQEAKKVDELPKQDGDATNGTSEKLMIRTPSHADFLNKKAVEKGVCLLIPALETAENKLPPEVSQEGHAEDDKVESSIIVQERSDELHFDGLTCKDEHTKETSPFSLKVQGLTSKDEHMKETSPSSLKGHMEVDSSFTSPEIASVDLPNTSAANDDMKVCDICGDAGFEDMLAVCSDCNGTEHVYCYESLMAQVPEGYWQCIVCKSKQKTGDFYLSTDVRVMNSPPARFASSISIKKQCSIGNARSRLSALLQKRRLPSDKKRTLKGVPSSQFPAKKGLMVDATDAPPAKKQALESSSTSNMPPPKFGLLREASFKAPETGKVKFVSPIALIGTSGEGPGPSSRGNGKLPLVAGSLNSVSMNSSAASSWQTSKGRLSSVSNSVVGTVNKVNTISQSNNPSSNVPYSPTGPKNVGALKSSDLLPSFLLPSKSMGSKLQPSSKGPMDNIPQNVMKDGITGQTATFNTRPLVKTSSFKLFKGIVKSEPKLKSEDGSDFARSSGPKGLHPEPGVSDGKHDDASMGRLVETACKVEATVEPHLQSDLHIVRDKTNKPTKGDLAGGFGVTKQTTEGEVTVAVSERSEAQISSALSSSGKDQALSMEEDGSIAAQVMSLSPLVKQLSRISESDTSVEVVSEAVQSAPSLPLPLPVLSAQESPTKTEGKRSLLLAVNVDTSGEKYVDKSPTQDDTRSTFTPRSRSFGAWGTPSYVPSLGSTRCYRCKELGHSAKNCNNRNSMPCLSTEAAGASKPVLPISNADGWLKGISCIDNAMPNLQIVAEIAPRIKPIMTEMAPVTKLPCTETMLVSVQALNSTVSKTQTSLQEGSVMDNFTPSLSPSVKSPPDDATKNDTLDCKQITMAIPVQSQGNVGGADATVKLIDIKTDNDINLLRTTNSTCVRASSGALLPLSAADGQPPLLPIPVVLKNAVHFPSLGSPSSAGMKVTSPLISRYEESLKVYPEAQIVWQGTFEVAGKAKTQIIFHGLQANPSNRALPKVREVAKKLQPSLFLEELPRGSEHNSWPVQFQKSPPINDNIALYFFASGKESYVQYYKPLVDRLIKFDLALKGFIEDAELLIFPSNLLPPGSQCWNNFMFLWAVFRARKLPIKQPTLHMEPKQVETEGSNVVKLPLQLGVLPWGKIEHTQTATSGNKNVDVLQVAGNKVETSSPTTADCVSSVGPFFVSDSQLVVSEQTTPHVMEVEAVGKERSEPKAQTEQISSHFEKLAATGMSTPQNSVAVVKGHPSSPPLSMEGASIMKAFNESQEPTSNIKPEEKVDASTRHVISSDVKPSSVLLTSEHGSIEKVKHSTPLMTTSPAPMVCPSPRDRQEDMWTPRKLSSEKGGRERAHDKSDRIESGRGVLRDRDRDKQKEREKQKERDRERERSRRHSDYEREKEKERGKDRDRDRDRERDRDRGREKERDRERWREREDRERRGRDWNRDREKTVEREKVRERGRERESERERALARERSCRHRHWDPEGDYGRSGRHWHKYTRSRSPSRSPPGKRDRSPSRARLDRYHHKYRRSSRHSRSYSRSPESDHGVGRLQPRAESRDLSKDSFIQKGKSLEIINAKEESVVKNSAAKDLNGDEQGNYSQRGSNSNSLCRENTAGAVRKLPIADLNLSPSEIEGYEEEGLEDGAVMSVEVAKPLSANQNDFTSNHYAYFHSKGGPGSASREPGECSISAGKAFNYSNAKPLVHVDERTVSLSHSMINDSSGPSLFPVSISIEGSSSCRQFFPQVPDEVPGTPDLNLALGAKEENPPQHEELPLFMQLLEPPQGHLRFSSSTDVPMVSEQADLSLSLAIPEHSKRPIVNTSLRLFG